MTVYKMIDIVGTSRTSVSDAVRGAVQRAAETLDDLQWFEVEEIRGRIVENEVMEYQVRLQVGFKLHGHETSGTTGTGARQREGTADARGQLAQVGAMGGQRKPSDVARGPEERPGKGGRRD